MRVRDASCAITRGSAREEMCDFTGVVPLGSSILISVLSVASRCNVLSNLLTTWTYDAVGRTGYENPRVQETRCGSRRSRMCIFLLNGRQIQTADLNKFASSLKKRVGQFLRSIYATLLSFELLSVEF